MLCNGHVDTMAIHKDRYIWHPHHHHKQGVMMVGMNLFLLKLKYAETILSRSTLL